MRLRFSRHTNRSHRRTRATTIVTELEADLLVTGGGVTGATECIEESLVLYRADEATSEDTD
jgi:hypothetical protein